MAGQAGGKSRSKKGSKSNSPKSKPTIGNKKATGKKTPAIKSAKKKK